MCSSIEVRTPLAYYCDTVGELRASLPIIVERGTDSDGESLRDDDCLCNVDPEATAKANGMTGRRATEEEGWPWPTYVIEATP
jgi:hypothetical protein